MTRRLLIIMAFVEAFHTFVVPAPTEATWQDVPLAIQELLPDNPNQDDWQMLPGMNRTQEPVTIGLPISSDSGITDIQQLGLSGASVGQFRILRRWPNGNAQWVLIDTQADISAQTQNTQIILTTGSGNFGGPDLAVDQGQTILIDTGVAEFTIRKSGFNIFDRVRVNGTELVSPGSSGIVLTGDNGTIFQGSRDPNVQVSIEENGPARAVILAKGTHFSSTGVRNMDFTIRMHFYKNKSGVKLIYSLRNASRSQVANIPFRSLELVIRSTLAQPGYVVATHNGELSGTLASDGTLRLFQGDNNFPQAQDYDFDESQNRPSGRMGYTIIQNSSTLAGGSQNQFMNLFYAQARGSGQERITIGTRFATGWWPQGLGLDGDGTLRVGVFPTGNDRRYYSRFNSHVTREILLDFSNSNANARNTFYRFQYPLAGKAANLQYYNQTKVFWDKLVSFQDESAYHDEMGWNPNINDYARLPENARPEFMIWRHKYWGEGGGHNQYDFSKINAYNFLRENRIEGGGYWLYAEQRFSYNADLAVRHSDDFHIHREPPSELPGQWSTFDDLPNADRIPTAKVIFEGEHRHAYGLGLWYYLTGDERYREVYTDWGEAMEWSEVRESWPEWERGLVWNIYNLVDLYRFTGDSVYRDMAWNRFSSDVLDAEAHHRNDRPPGFPGTDWQRGFFVSLSDAQAEDRSMAAFIKGAMFPRTYAYLHDFGTTNGQQADRARDVLEGMVRFVSHELWFEYGANPGDFGFPYRISADSAPLQDIRTDPEFYGGLKEAYLTFVYGYLLTGEQQFLDRGTLLLQASAFNTPSAGANPWFRDWPEKQTLQYLIQHTSEFDVWHELLPINVVQTSPGNFRISWTVPVGAKQYWLKYSNKQIVPWLNFDRYTRQFQYNPNQYVPFFAATNVPSEDVSANEPIPGTSGTLQEMEVNGLDPTKQWRFSMKYLAQGTSPNQNAAPSVDAGQDQAVTERNSVTLTGSATDPEGGALTYAWSQVSGPSVQISDANTLSASFTAPAVDDTSVLVFQLRVTDPQEGVGTDTVTITVRNGPDSDGDGLDDLDEQAFGSLSNDSDSDDDGWNDLYEWVSGTEPLNSSSFQTDWLNANFNNGQAPNFSDSGNNSVSWTVLSQQYEARTGNSAGYSWKSDSHHLRRLKNFFISYDVTFMDNARWSHVQLFGARIDINRVRLGIGSSWIASSLALNKKHHVLLWVRKSNSGYRVNAYIDDAYIFNKALTPSGVNNGFSLSSSSDPNTTLLYDNLYIGPVPNPFEIPFSDAFSKGYRAWISETGSRWQHSRILWKITSGVMQSSVKSAGTKYSLLRVLSFNLASNKDYRIEYDVRFLEGAIWGGFYAGGIHFDVNRSRFAARDGLSIKGGVDQRHTPGLTANAWHHVVAVLRHGDVQTGTPPSWSLTVDGAVRVNNETLDRTLSGGVFGLISNFYQGLVQYDNLRVTEEPPA